MKNFPERICICILVVLVIFNLCSIASAQQTRAELVQLPNEKGKTENIQLYEGSYALLIGSSKYTNGWNELPGVNDDLPEVEKALTKQHFVVEKLVDPTSKNLLPTINQFVNNYGFQVNNRLLIYFAGHGFTELAGDGRKFGYIVPVDAPVPSKDLLGFQKKAVTMDDIESIARKIRSKHVLFLFDSCFSGTLLSRRGTISTNISIKAAEPVRQFITAGAEDQEVPDVSIFRRQFVEGIGGEADWNGDGYVTGTELAEFLKEKVTNYTRGSQTPLYGKIFDQALDKGDFIFIVGEQSKRPPRKPVVTQSEERVTPKIEIPKKQGFQPQTLSVSEFTKTDVCVEDGTAVSVTAEGTISLGQHVKNTNPAGKNSFQTFLGLTLPIDKQYYLEQDFPLGALLCRFDYSEKWNYCSTSRTLTAERKGCLILEVNDKDKSDNRGAYRVNIKPL